MMKIKFACSALVTLSSFVCMFASAFIENYTLAFMSLSSFVGWVYHAMDDYKDMITISKIAKKYEQYDPAN